MHQNGTVLLFRGAVYSECPLSDVLLICLGESVESVGKRYRIPGQL